MAQTVLCFLFAHTHPPTNLVSTPCQRHQSLTCSEVEDDGIFYDQLRRFCHEITLVYTTADGGLGCICEVACKERQCPHIAGIAQVTERHDYFKHPLPMAPGRARKSKKVRGDLAQAMMEESRGRGVAASADAGLAEDSLFPDAPSASAASGGVAGPAPGSPAFAESGLSGAASASGAGGGADARPTAPSGDTSGERTPQITRRWGNGEASSDADDRPTPRSDSKSGDRTPEVARRWGNDDSDGELLLGGASVGARRSRTPPPRPDRAAPAVARAAPLSAQLGAPPRSAGPSAPRPAASRTQSVPRQAVVAAAARPALRGAQQHARRPPTPAREEPASSNAPSQAAAAAAVAPRAALRGAQQEVRGPLPPARPVSASPAVPRQAVAAAAPRPALRGALPQAPRAQPPTHLRPASPSQLRGAAATPCATTSAGFAVGAALAQASPRPLQPQRAASSSAADAPSPRAVGGAAATLQVPRDVVDQMARMFERTEAAHIEAMCWWLGPADSDKVTTAVMTDQVATGTNVEETPAGAVQLVNYLVKSKLVVKAWCHSHHDGLQPTPSVADLEQAWHHQNALQRQFPMAIVWRAGKYATSPGMAIWVIDDEQSRVLKHCRGRVRGSGAEQHLRALDPRRGEFDLEAPVFLARPRLAPAQGTQSSDSHAAHRAPVVASRDSYLDDVLLHYLRATARTNGVVPLGWYSTAPRPWGAENLGEIRESFIQSLKRLAKSGRVSATWGASRKFEDWLITVLPAEPNAGRSALSARS